MCKKAKITSERVTCLLLSPVARPRRDFRAVTLDFAQLVFYKQLLSNYKLSIEYDSPIKKTANLLRPLWDSGIKARCFDQGMI